MQIYLQQAVTTRGSAGQHSGCAAYVSMVESVGEGCPEGDLSCMRALTSEWLLAEGNTLCSGNCARTSNLAVTFDRNQVYRACPVVLLLGVALSISARLARRID